LPLCLHLKHRFYKMDYPNRGIALIFTFDRLNNCPTRNFNFHMNDDADRLSQTFKDLDFDIHKYSSLNKSHFEEIINDYSKRNYANDDCFLCIVIGHGNKNEEVMCADGEMYNTDNIKSIFSKVATLKDKPKILLHGCCRGNVISTEIKDERICSPLAKETTLKENHEKGLLSEEINEIIPLANEKRKEEQIDGNFFTFYSTTHGYLAWGSTLKGSNPFQRLCDILKIYGFRWTFDGILLDVKDRVAYLKHTYKNIDTDVEVTVFCESTDNNRKYIRFTKKTK
jgi:hypothetical protein